MWLRHAPRRVRWLAGLVFASLALSGGLPLASAQEARPRRVFKDAVVAVDDLLTRPYGPDIPFGSVGARLWATSPQSWGFPSDVHWLYLTNLGPIDLEVRDALGPLAPARATYAPSHVHIEGAERLLAASASSAHRGDSVEHPLTKPFTPEKRWSSGVSGRPSDWFELDLGRTLTLKGLKLWFSDDAGQGRCRVPQRYEIQVPEGDGWKPIRLTSLAPEAPAPGENTALFGPLAAAKVRVVLYHADPDHSSGLYGIEPLEADPQAATSGPAAVPLVISADKFLTPDDGLAIVLRIKNPTAAPQVVEVVPVVDWEGQYEGRILTNRPAGSSDAPFGTWVVEAEARNRLHGFDVIERLRYAVTSDPPRPLDVTESRRFTVAVARGRADNAAFLRKALGFRYTIGPNETWVFKAAVEIKRPEEPSGLDRILTPPSTFTRSLEAKSARLGMISVERQDARTVLPEQVANAQAWYDANLAAFDCSDPLVRKMFYHRAYTLRKNSMDPKLGSLKWPTQSEGRWRSTWYPNVISYGAAHQIREARWLADPRAWSGHLQTWANNQKPDHVYPSHVTPAGPSTGQYTDWITSTAWDGHLVHPDKTLLGSLADKLADNVRGWQATCDPDGDGLLAVDSHWWTGMEFQPSFFAFGAFQTSADYQQPATPVALERVDLTAYNFGNARAVSHIYRALGQPQKAKEFDDLAAKIRSAVAARMWDKDDGFFYSLRAEDHAPAKVKEIVGVYPFYFDMFPPADGYGKAWASILDPAQFWTAWPVASVSKQCPAYSQLGWPAADNRPIAACMWNGPTWPHANSLVLTAMARTLRADRTLAEKDQENASPLSREKLWELFLSFTKAQYRNQDPTFPWTGEYYNGDTGQWKTAERDYNHSTWLDILIPDLVGLVPRDDDVLEIDPLIPAGALAHFTLDGQRYHGRDVTVAWDAPGDNTDAHADGREGLEVYLDGTLVASSPELKRLLIDMKTGKPIDEKPAKPAAPAATRPKP